MILIAFANVLLIVFDWTYFYARPYLFEYAPAITTAYDPIKAVEKNAKTEQYLDLSDRYFEAANAEERAPIAEQLIALSRDMAAENPFAASGQSVNLKRAADQLANFSTHGIKTESRAPRYIPLPGELTSDRAFETVPAFATVSEVFWTAGVSEQSREFFQSEVRPLFEINFNRRRSLDGNYKDYFLLLDGPFLILFLLEFLVRWFLAIRRRELARWWLFPIYNWYDVLGLIPFAEFRIFRLFRVLSIYVRLHRSDLTNIGDDFVSRTVKRYSAILTEEVSDRVAARILTEMQDEIQRGASIDIFLTALEPRREQIKKLIVGYVQRFSEKRPGEQKTRALLGNSLEDAARNVPSLQLVPDFLKERLTREIGVAVFDAINETLAQSVRGERGEEIVGEVVDLVMDDILKEGQGSPVDELYRTVSLDVLENMKAAVAQKKWAR